MTTEASRTPIALNHDKQPRVVQNDGPDSQAR
ncbi:predicted protein [Sclerotinia sclerotiorum 1980 UF-70]|uniref:Uncharacterized protein n=1 Tax=Sclerotinia sclerotiorum (strain ATCC 18683 / 1980 / Ss-1) TaxID=665079 RepID=A7F0S9_SCLS1|nr:predicted protein [Sclerotinia sclerotiorum 1980 UF-70]EDN95321.1 predicted protein [Sclerotinia sclerotiorum 1980 UF-70]